MTEKPRLWALVSAAMFASATYVGSPAVAGYVSFDPPGSNFTWPTRINDTGTIAGWWFDGNLYHGFVRTPDGSIASFDPPGSVETTPIGMNEKGVIVGTYTRDNYSPRTYHGFIRDTDGKLKTYDALGDYTSIWAINKTGTMTGHYLDINGSHGFIRDGNHNFTSFDPPGSWGTFPMAINSKGAVTGSYYHDGADACGTFLIRGFIRAPDGNMTTFDFQNEVSPSSINSHGVVAGSVSDDRCVPEGFVRGSNGTYQTFEFPGSTNTVNVFDMNEHGTSVGFYWEATWDNPHGFQRTRNGTMTMIEPDGAYSSQASGINYNGQITGWYIIKKHGL